MYLNERIKGLLFKSKENKAKQYFWNFICFAIIKYLMEHCILLLLKNLKDKEL